MSRLRALGATLPAAGFIRAAVAIAGATGVAQLIGILASPIITPAT